MNVEFDSNWYTRCDGCFEAIEPADAKLVIGKSNGVLEVYCADCSWREIDVNVIHSPSNS